MIRPCCIVELIHCSTFLEADLKYKTMENGNLNQSLLDLLVAACRYALHVCLEGGGGRGKLANFFRYLTLPVLSFALGLIINIHYPVLLEA